MTNNSNLLLLHFVELMRHPLVRAVKLTATTMYSWAKQRQVYQDQPCVDEAASVYKTRLEDL
jgi:hypothetical protein